MFVKNNSSEIRISAFPYHSPIARLGRAESVCAMTSHGDAIGKMSSFASRADSFVNAALDQLDDAVEQAFVGDGNSDEVAKLNAAAMTPAQTALLKTTSSFWQTLALDAKREDWRDAASQIANCKTRVEDSKRALAEVARDAKTAENTDALLKALTHELASVNKRATFAETAFMSMLNDIDEAPDPAAALVMGVDAGEVVTSAARSRAELDKLRATHALAAGAVRELENLKASFDLRVDEASSVRSRDAEGRAAAADVKAEANLKLFHEKEREVSVLRKARDDAETQIFALETRLSERFEETPDEETDSERARLFEEIRGLRRELDMRRNGTNVDRSHEKFGDDDETGNGGTASLLASLREKVSAKESVVEQLKMALEESEAANERDREAFAVREDALLLETEQKTKETQVRLEQFASSSFAANRTRIEALENRCDVLRALVDAEDGEAVDALLSQGSGAIGSSDETHDVSPLAAARARNRRLASDASDAKREAAAAKQKAEDVEKRLVSAESLLAARELAVAELEKHLVAATGKEGNVGVGSSARGADNCGDDFYTTNDALLPMVAAQRDRHKKRASELEGKVLALEQKLEEEKTVSEKSQPDAVVLYEKVRPVQDCYTKNAPRTSRPPGATRIVRVDDAGHAMDVADGPLAALAARRQKLLRYGCFPNAHAGSVGGGIHTENAAGSIPGGDPGGVLARYALMKNNAIGTGLFPTLGGKSRAAKVTRLVFIAYLVFIHVALLRRAIGSTAA